MNCEQTANLATPGTNVMRGCIYTTNHSRWLHFMLEHCSATDRVCFRSKRPWVTAKQALEGTSQEFIPILIRRIHEDGTGEFCCSYFADLVEIYSRSELPKGADLRPWLDKKLWLQRQSIKREPDLLEFSGWKSQYMAWEVNQCVIAKTLYVIRNLRPIKPLPLDRLVKFKDGERLSREFKYGYSICIYSEDDIVFSKSD